MLLALVLVPTVVLAGCGSGHASSQAPPVSLRTAPIDATSGDAGGITAHGTGQVSGAPDVMTISVGVNTQAAHATDALGQNASKATAVINSLKGHGVPASDIQTSELSLQPNYDNSGRVITGYQATDVVTAKLHNLTDAGQVIDAAVGAAGDAGRLDGVSFSIDDNSNLLAQARKDAVAAAAAQAQQLASAAGVHLGALRSLSEDVNTPGPINFAEGAAMSAASAPTPVEPGTQQVSVQVTAIWDVG